MKKTILTLTCILSLFLAAQAQIVITEIMYNPPEANTDSLEYIELYNNSNAPVNMENWTMFGVVFTFPAITLQPGDFVVVAVNAAAVQNQFGATALQWTSQALTNTGETLRVLDAGGNTIDEVTYSNIAPWPLEAAGNGASIVLCDPNSDNSVAGNWQAATTSTGVTINGKEIFANPGEAAICGPVVLQAINDQAVAASGQALILNVLANDLQPNPLSGPVLIATPPAHGNATVNPDNSITYTSNPGYCGSDEFEYQVCDANGCDIGAVTLEVKCYKAYTIAQVSGENADGAADSLDVDCELTGTVYGVNIRPVNNNQPSLQFTVIDDNGNGIAVSKLIGNLGYTVKEKDKITLRGTIGQFNGLTEIQPDFITKISENNPLLAPTVVTKLDESTESKLIRINNLHFVDTSEWDNGAPTISGFNVRVVSDDHPQDTILLRIDRDVETFNSPLPNAPFNLVGLGGQFDSSTPYSSGYQILPRYNPDISTLVGVQNADFSANVRLAPNPVRDRLLLQTDLQFDRLRLFASSGVLVKTLENPALTQEIPVNTLPKGVYFIQFEKEGKTWATRFVKQ